MYARPVAMMGRGFWDNFKWLLNMKCDTCAFKEIHIGAGPPDDYSMEYCGKGYWEGGDFDEHQTVDFWELCLDYRCQDCGGSGAVEIGPSQYSTCPCSI